MSTRLQRPAMAFWSGPSRRLAWLLTLSLVGLTVAQVAIPIAMNAWNGRMFDALEMRDMPQLVRQIGYLSLIVIANMIVLTSHLRVRRRLQIAWRDDLTRRIVAQWRSKTMERDTPMAIVQYDNPDGRIAEDIRIATEYSVDLVHSLLYCSMLLVSFTQILWVLSGPAIVDYGIWQFWLPGHLVWIALLYAGLGAAAATLLGRPLVRAASFRQAREADFRFGLVQARESGQHGAAGGELTGLFRELVGAWQGQTRALANLFMFSSSWTVLTQAVPVLVSAPRYIAEVITLGTLMQSAQAFLQMISALSWPIDNMQKLAECRASIRRVQQLHQSLAGPVPTSSSAW